MLPFGTVVPMLVAASRPFHDDAYTYEAKLDGIRTLAWVTDEGVRLQNRRLREMTSRYPDVVAATREAVKGPSIVDGEVVVLIDGVPRFRRLLSRENSDVSRVARLVAELPATYYLFDVLFAEGRDVRAEPLEERRRILREIVRTDATPVSPVLPGDGREVFRRVVDAQFEGIVAKRRGSPYLVGERTRDWLKVKRIGELDAVVGGWTEGEGRRGGTIGSLVLGLWEDEGLRYVGRVGSGLTDADLATLAPALRGLARTTSPFLNKVDVRAHWVEPALVVHVEYHEVTEDLRLRGPAFKGLRDDKPPSDCTLAGELAAAVG